MSSAPRVGDIAPDIDTTDHRGQPVSLRALRGKPVVVFFYPGDFTPVCTAQSCGFRDAYEDFASAGATVIGISKDPQASHEKFAGKFMLPFALLTDADGALAQRFGVSRALFGLFPGRETLVIAPDGTIAMRFRSGLLASAHVKRALAKVRELTPRNP
jgi:peroxiredoxin Q/BCP